jgi:CubicO group peptidase (beta-lactamase class C family)
MFKVPKMKRNMRLLLIFLLVICAVYSGAQDPTPAVEKQTRRSVYKAAEFPDSDRVGKIQKALAVVDKMFSTHAARNHYPGVVYGVVVDGQLVHSGARGVLNLDTNVPAKTSSLFRIASMTKSFTAMAILKLRDEGKLSLTDPAEKYVTEMKNFQYLTADAPKITIQNLLTMTAGFPEDNPWGDRQLEDTDEEFLKFLKGGVSFSNIPGHRFEYSNLGYAILGNIITRLSGMPYQKYISQYILQPLGMNDTRWEYSEVKKDQLAIGYRWEDEKWKVEPMLHDGAYGAMGGLITSINDFSKYVALHLSAWPPSNAPETGPLKRNSIREMHRPFLSQLFVDGKRADGSPCPLVYGYGYGLGYRQDCKGVVRVSHSGGLPGFGSEFRFYPEYGIGVVSFANLTYAGTGGLNGRVLDTLVAISGIKSRIIPPSEILSKRKDQLVKLLTSWDEKLGAEILAENFFLDRSRESWIKFSSELLQQTGKFVAYQPLVAENQLRGVFEIIGEQKVMKVFFTLTPEANPKVQQLDLSIVSDD